MRTKKVHELALEDFMEGEVWLDAESYYDATSEGDGATPEEDEVIELSAENASFDFEVARLYTLVTVTFADGQCRQGIGTIRGSDRTPYLLEFFPDGLRVQVPVPSGLMTDAEEEVASNRLGLELGALYPLTVEFRTRRSEAPKSLVFA